MAEKRNRRLPEPRPVKGRPNLWAVDVPLEGVARRRRVYGTSYDDCTANMITVLADHARGAPAVHDAGTVAEYLARWLQEKQSHVRASSWERYRQIIEHHLIPAVGRIQLTRLQSADVKKMLQQATGKKGGKKPKSVPLGPRSLRQVRDVLRSALNDAMAEDLVIRNAAMNIRTPKPPKSKGVALTPEQAKSLLIASQGTRFEAFVAVGLALGLRLGECLGLQWRNVDLENRRLYVRQQLQNLAGRRTLVDPKTDTVEERELPPFAVAALRRHRATVNRQRLAAEDWSDHDLVLPRLDGRPWVHQSFRASWRLFLAGAGLPTTWNPHDLRRSCVTLLLAAGVPPAEVMRYVGHQSMAMTMQIYNRLTETATAPATLERLFGESVAE